MTAEQVLAAISKYRRYFEENGIDKKDHPHDEAVADSGCALRHCHGMLDKMEEFVRTGHLEKAFRWLGFLQGVLWAENVYTLDELKDDNR